ncbi:ATP-binding protein [Lentzea sp. NPDC004789]
MGDPEVCNTTAGVVNGPVVQAGSIHGDVHLHAPWSVITPRQLPAAVNHFVGRTAQLAALSRHVDEAATRPGAVTVAAIEGMPGVGKSALALRWAHDNVSRFPDGQLYVDLRGFAPSGAMDPGEALWGFLHALGLPKDAPPLDLNAQAGLYRSMLAGRRMLIVLDNARDTDQIRPLLPGTAACHVLITSRYRLTGLVAETGARPISLGCLTHDESALLLGTLLDDDRRTTAAGSVSTLVEHCGRLPLALRIAGARLAGSPDLPVELGEDRLGTLDTGEPEANVTAVFSWSCNALPAPAASLFRLLSVHPGPDFGAAAAAAIAGRPRADRLLSELTRAHLLEQRPRQRYGFHDLLRLYAEEQALEVDTAQDRQAATHRMLDHYLHTCIAADSYLGTPWDPVHADAPLPGAKPAPVGDSRAATAWFAAEHPVLMALVVEQAPDEHAWRIAHTMVTYLDRQGHWRDLITTQRAALAAAERLANPAALAMSHRLLGRALSRARQYEASRHHLDLALAAFQANDDVPGQAHTHYALAFLDVVTGHHRDAITHNTRALALARACGRATWEAKALNNIGWCHLRQGDHRQAMRHCRQALALFEKLGTDPDGQAHVQECVGDAHRGLGEFEAALRHYGEALRIREELGNHYTQAGTLRHIAAVHRASGDVHAEQNALRHALVILDRLGHPKAAAVRTALQSVETLSRSRHRR